MYSKQRTGDRKVKSKKFEMRCWGKLHVKCSLIHRNFDFGFGHGLAGRFPLSSRTTWTREVKTFGVLGLSSASRSRGSDELLICHSLQGGGERSR